jgi:hypothetical protein
MELAGYLRKLTQKVRDFRKALKATIEYYANIEFRHGRPHIHMTVISSLDWSIYKTKAVVKEWWSSSCPERLTTAVYCDHVHNPIGLANYLPKNVKDRSHVEMPPEAWNSRTCRLVWRSRGFLTKRKEDLWREQCQEWYPPHATVQPQDTTCSPLPDPPPKARQDRPGRSQTAFLAPQRALGHLRRNEPGNGTRWRPGDWLNPFIWLYSVKKPRGP